MFESKITLQFLGEQTAYDAYSYCLKIISENPQLKEMANNYRTDQRNSSDYIYCELLIRIMILMEQVYSAIQNSKNEKLWKYRITAVISCHQRAVEEFYGDIAETDFCLWYRSIFKTNHSKLR